MERLRRLHPDEMSAEQRELYEKFATGRRVQPGSPFSLVHPDGGLTGPPNGWLLSPPIGRALEQLGLAVRYELELPPRCREIVILIVAFHRNSAFELFAHRRAAAAAGLTETEIEGLATAPGPDFANADERVAQATARALIANGTLDDTGYAEAVDVLGERGLFEVIVLVGYYMMVATQLATFGVEPPAAGAAS
jgi:alkylhydroperoxidase family enzyme